VTERGQQGANSGIFPQFIYAYQNIKLIFALPPSKEFPSHVNMLSGKHIINLHAAVGCIVHDKMLGIGSLAPIS
jgi:hypothetical protein